MTAQDELRALSEEIAAAEHDPFEPRCVARAFASGPATPAFTMRRWIDLSAIRSPLLLGMIPADLVDLAAAAEVFGLAAEVLAPDEQRILAETLRDAISAAFAMALPMRPRDAEQDARHGGFGSWLPIYAFLVFQGGKSRAEALAWPVVEVFAAIAAHRYNQGWEVGGTTYALRNLDDMSGFGSSNEEEKTDITTVEDAK